MTENQAAKLRERIAQMEHEMMEFRISMASLLMGLYETLHELERKQRWSYKPGSIEQLKTLRDCIVQHFDEGELKTMCFDLGVNYDDLDGEGISDKTTELVLFMNRNGRSAELTNYCRTHRPHAKTML